MIFWGLRTIRKFYFFLNSPVLKTLHTQYSSLLYKQPILQITNDAKLLLSCAFTIISGMVMLKKPDFYFLLKGCFHTGFICKCLNIGVFFFLIKNVCTNNIFYYFLLLLLRSAYIYIFFVFKNNSCIVHVHQCIRCLIQTVL